MIYIVLLLASLGLVACDSTPKQNPSAQTTVSALQLAPETQDPFYACVAQIKSQMLAGDFEFPTDPRIQDKLAPIQGTYSRVTGKRGNPKTEFETQKNNDFLTVLTLKKSWQADQDSIELSFSLNDHVDEQHLSHRLALAVTLTTSQSGLIQSALSQSYNIDMNQGCKPLLKHVGLAHYKREAKSLYVEKTSLSVINNTFETEEKSFALNTPECPSDSEIDKSTYSRSFEMTCFNPTDSFEMTVKYSPSNIEALDPLTQETTSFTKYRVDVQAFGKDFVYEILKSNQSDYKLSNNPVISSLKSEVINEALWVEATFDKDRQAMPELGSKIDWVLNGQKYKMTSPMPLNFDNFAGYFKILSTDVTSEKTEAMIELSADDYLVGKFVANLHKPLPQPVDPKFQAFLEPTFYIDFQHPAFEPLIASLRSQIHAETTQYEVINLILATLSEHLEYDFRMWTGGGTGFIKASDTLMRRTGVCQHYAAVFVALSRALGIPARIVMGLQQSGEGKRPNHIGHAWVEILLDGDLWLPIEPQKSKLEQLIYEHYIPTGVSSDYEQKAPNTVTIEQVDTTRLWRELEIRNIGSSEPQ